MKGRVRVAVAAALAAAAVALVLAAVHVWRFRDCYVMVTVEESSTSAMTSWPLLSERMPGSFLDAGDRSLILDERPALLGVSMCLHYTASSQGIEIADSVRFSRTGRAVLDLDRPLSYVTGNLDGEPVELVNNRARVLAGDLVIEKTYSDGTVRFWYGGRRVTLGPGESWAELLALTPEGPKPIDPANWESEFRTYLEEGCPTTRLAVANRGLWPKSGVIAGVAP
ncbi:MAG: hypothetical protein ACM3WU_05710 [Bacillota bacterium]